MIVDEAALSVFIDDRVRAVLAERVDEPVLLKVSEAARLLGMSSRTAYDRIRAGRLRCVKDGSVMRVPRVAVDEYVAELGSDGDSRRVVPARRVVKPREPNGSEW